MCLTEAVSLQKFLIFNMCLINILSTTEKYMYYKFTGSMAEEDECREAIPKFGCNDDNCLYACVKKLGMIDVVGYCENPILCVCYYRCRVKEMDATDSGISPLPSTPSSPDISSETKNH